nr:2Fe-2S iron-sulfur cluster-binding protein [Gluconobacter morbifer]
MPVDLPMHIAKLSRRMVLRGAMALLSASQILRPVWARALASRRHTPPSHPPKGVETAMAAFSVNGEHYDLTVDTRTTLLDLLREQLILTGTHKGCDHGQCGACTILVNGQRILSCLSLAAMHEGDSITTIEGLSAANGTLHPVQAAFIDHDGFQCGYCTSGQICSAVGMLRELAAGNPSYITADLSAHPEAVTEELHERMSGNLCRCSAYVGISVALIELARTKVPA